MSRATIIYAAGLVVVAVIFPLVVPNYLINIGLMVLFVAFLGQAWNLSGGFAGQLSFGHVMFFGVGAYTSAILQVSYGWNPWLAWPVATLVGGLVGGGVAVLAFRAGLRGSYFALITLAFAEMFRIIANSASFTGGGLGILISADQRALNFQFRDPVWFYYIALTLCLVSILVAWRLTRSRFGARLIAIRESEDAARALGIDVLLEKVKVLALSATLCAAGGAFYMQKYLYLDPWIAFGLDKSVEMLLVTMVGGTGTIIGPLVGSLALTTINELTRALANGVPALQNAQPLSLIVYGLMLLLIVARLPAGLVSLLSKRQRDA